MSVRERERERDDKGGKTVGERQQWRE